MIKLKITTKPFYSQAIVCVVMISICLFLPNVNATEVPDSKPIPNEHYLNRESLQPYATCLEVDELKNWSPDNDPDARYNRSSVRLHDRYTGPVVNPYASTQAKVMALVSDSGLSQGGNTENAYAFNYFQYIDTYNFWGSVALKGCIIIPSAEHIDSAHRNGVKATGTIFFPWNDSEYVNEAMTQFTQKDADGNYIIADKLFEIAEYYGFDGFFINEETSVSSELASELRNMLSYIQENKPENFVMQWYDSMLPNGQVWYQDEVNENNIGMLQDGDKRYNDEVFINFNWGTNKINKSVNTMKKAGRSPFDVFASWENIPYEDYAGHPGRVEYLLDENNKIKTSIGILGTDCTLSASSEPEDFTNEKEGMLWVGPTFNPTDTTTRDNDTKFPGMSSLIADKTPIVGTDFVTHFTTGNGYKFYENGVITGKLDGWYNRSLTDVLPTWRWIVESNGSKLKPSIDYSDAYWGGTSLKIEGKLEQANPNHIKLYSTKLDIKDNSKLSIIYKTPLDMTNMKVGLCFGDTYADENFAFFDVTDLIPGEWNTQEINLSSHAGKTAIAISLKFESTKDINDYSMNIGRLAITTTNVIPSSIDTVTFDEIMFHDYKNAEARIYWDKAENAAFYEIHRVKADNLREFIGATPNNAFYIPLFERDGSETDFNFEITPVNYASQKGTAKILNFKWLHPENTSEPLDKTKRINLALNKSVTSNVESEPCQGPENLVDGVITNSKWCVSSTHASPYNPHIATIDLGEEMEIGRWVVWHANCPGASESPDMNTIDFKLSYSTDGINFIDADVVKGNTLDITDRNLSTPIKARYVSLTVTKSDKSPWHATRIYEIELYKDSYTKRTEALKPASVYVRNNADVPDIARFENVTAGITVKLYNSIDATQSITEKTCEEGMNYVEFSNLDLGDSEGRLYYATLAENAKESLRRSVPYYSEPGKELIIADNDVEFVRSIKGKQNVAPTGILTLKNLPENAVLRVFSDAISNSPILISVPANENNTIKQERIPLTPEGGNVYIEVSAKGYSTPKRKIIVYSEVDTMKGDPSPLKETIDKYSNLTETDYLPTQWAIFVTALENAKTVLNNPDSTSIKLSQAQEDLKTAARHLRHKDN